MNKGVIGNGFNVHGPRAVGEADRRPARRIPAVNPGSTRDDHSVEMASLFIS